MTTGRWVWLGILGGWLGGVLDAVVVMANELAAGHSMFTPLHMIAAPVVGMGPMEVAMTGGALYLDPVPALLGFLGHMGWSAVWGALFGLVAAGARLTGRAAMWWGPIYGIGVGLVMSAVVVPVFGLKAMWEVQPIAIFLLGHALYGLGPGLAIWLGTREMAVTRAVEQRRRAA